MPRSWSQSFHGLARSQKAKDPTSEKASEDAEKTYTARDSKRGPAKSQSPGVGEPRRGCCRLPASGGRWLRFSNALEGAVEWLLCGRQSSDSSRHLAILRCCSVKSDSNSGGARPSEEATAENVSDLSGLKEPEQYCSGQSQSIEHLGYRFIVRRSRTDRPSAPEPNSIMLPGSGVSLMPW